MIKKFDVMCRNSWFVREIHVQWLNNETHEFLYIWIYPTKGLTLFCTGCTIGYLGINCTDKCPYPAYGLKCQKRCNCGIKVCDHVSGCSVEHGKFENFDSIFNLLCSIFKILLSVIETGDFKSIWWFSYLN